MAKSKSIHDLQGSLGGLTFVNSRAYGKHVRAARGTYKKAKVNKAFKKQSRSLLKANIPAKIVRDAIKLYLDHLPAGTLWSRLVSMFDEQLKENRVIDFSKLGSFEVGKEHSFDEFLVSDLEVSPDKKNHAIRVVLSCPEPPKFPKSKFIDGYRLGVIGIFPDAVKNKAKSTAIYTEIMRLKEKVSPLTFEVPVPTGAKSCLLCLRIDGCLKDVVNHKKTTKGMKVAWSGLI
jgi:hypothetical protein